MNTDNNNLKYLSLFPCPNQKGKLGSLLLLFQSELFSLDMLILYLNKKFNEVGIRDFLINKLYNLSDQEVDFYLPEICYLVIKRDSFELERFLIDRCVKNLAYCFKISWIIGAFGESNRKDKKKYEKIEKLLRYCEFSMMNGNMFLEESFRVRPNFSFKDPSKFEKDIIEKEHKKIYNEYVKKMIKHMTKISLTLKSVNPEDRKAKLLEHIKKINGIIESHRKKYLIDKKIEILDNFHGIMIPFSHIGHNSPFNSNLIVKIIESDFIPFNTKKRVPYKISVETIDVKDLRDFQLNFDNFENDTILTEADLTEDSHELATTTSSSMEDLAKIKINKYQGLANFAKKIVDAEKKVELGSEIKTTPTWKKKFPKKLQVIFNLFGENNENNSINTNHFEQIPDKNTGHLNSSNDLDLVHNQKSEIAKYRRQFNKDFPIKKLKKTQSLQYIKMTKPEETPKVFQRLTMLKPALRTSNMNNLLDLSFEKDIKNKKFVRELSWKKLNCKETLNFLENLKNSSNEAQKEEVLANMLRKIENEIENEEKSSPKLSIIGKINGPWGELWEKKVINFQKNSMYGHFPSYQIRNIIIKGGDDLRQELVAMQLIIKFKQIFDDAALKLFIRPYDIMVTSPNSGILEFIPNTLSIDGLKKNFKDTMNLSVFSLLEIYENVFEYEFEEAQKNFIESLAGYSLVCYLLQIKDRHNGNILIDSQGHIIHIDFGFMLSLSPGGINFESAPFKLTSEYVDLLGGKESETFNYFKILLVQGFMELRKYVDSIVYLLEIMMEDSDLPCFQEFDLKVFRSRFFEKSTDKECFEFVEKLIDMSYDNWRTVQYDNFQKMTNGILT